MIQSRTVTELNLKDYETHYRRTVKLNLLRYHLGSVFAFRGNKSLVIVNNVIKLGKTKKITECTNEQHQHPHIRTPCKNIVAARDACIHLTMLYEDVIT